MKSTKVRIEAPRRVGEETEFFLQRNIPGTMACTAHIHSAVELLYIKEGSFTAVLDGADFDLDEGDLILFCSNAIHHVFAKNSLSSRYYVIKIPPSIFPEMSGRETGAEYVMRFALQHKGGKCLWTAAELAVSPLLPILQTLVQEYESKTYAFDFAMKLKIMELLLTILREDHLKDEQPQSRMTEMIYQVVLYVRQHFAEDISEQKLAHDLGLSYSYFSRNFKKVTGLTFKQYLNRTRINHAEQLLLTSHLSVSEVATRCGFNNISYFISVYRSLKGETPLKTHRTAGK